MHSFCSAGMVFTSTFPPATSTSCPAMVVRLARSCAESGWEGEIADNSSETDRLVSAVSSICGRLYIDKYGGTIGKGLFNAVS